MFKLVTNDQDIIDRLKVVTGSDYTYLLSDDVKAFEDDKINILIAPSRLHEIEKMLDLLASGEEIYLVVNDERGQKRILVDQIQYIESFGDELFVQMKEKRFLLKSRLYQVEEVVLKKEFIRISKSHLVNLKKIDYISPAINSKIMLVMKNGDQVEVKRTYLKDFKQALEL